jgi:hypothetical protein
MRESVAGEVIQGAAVIVLQLFRDGLSRSVVRDNHGVEW